MESGFLQPWLSSFSAVTEWILNDSLKCPTDMHSCFVVTALIFVTVKFCIGSPLLPVNKDWGPDSYSVSLMTVGVIWDTHVFPKRRCSVAGKGNLRVWPLSGHRFSGSSALFTSCLGQKSDRAAVLWSSQKPAGKKGTLCAH